MRARALAIALATGAVAALVGPATPALAQNYTVAVDPDYIVVPPGAQVEFKATLLHKGSAEFSNSSWEWFAINGGRFNDRKTRLNRNVFLAPQKPGTYIVEVTTDRAARIGEKGRAEVVVKDVPPHRHFFKLQPEAVRIKTGQRIRFAFDSCGCAKAEGIRWWGQGGSWEPGGIFVAGNTAGRYQVCGECNGIQGSAWVEIEAALSCARVAIAAPVTQCYVGESVRFGAQAWDQNNNPYNNVAWDWQCEGGEIRGGVYTAGPRPGRYKIVVIDSYSKCAAEVWIEVIARVQLARLTVEPGNIEVIPGQRVQFRAGAYDQHGNPYPHVRLEWGASGGSIDGNGIYTAGPNPGRARVTVFDHNSGQAAFVWITIKRAGAHFLVLQPRVQRIRPGEKVQLLVEYYDDELNPIAATGITFGCDGGAIEGGWWWPRGCQPGRTYKVWVKDDVTGATDTVLVHVTDGRGRGWRRDRDRDGDRRR